MRLADTPAPTIRYVETREVNDIVHGYGLTLIGLHDTLLRRAKAAGAGYQGWRRERHNEGGERIGPQIMVEDAIVADIHQIAARLAAEMDAIIARRLSERGDA